MQLHYQIEILSPTRPTWEPYEMLKESLDDLESYVFCLRKAFPTVCWPDRHWPSQKASASIWTAACRSISPIPRLRC